MADEITTVLATDLSEQTDEPGAESIIILHKTTNPVATRFFKYSMLPGWILKTDAISSAMLQAGSVTNAKLGAKAVKAANIDDRAVGADQIGLEAVEPQHIKPESIDSDLLVAKGIVGSRIDDDTIPARCFEGDAVSSEIEEYFGIEVQKNKFNKATMIVDGKYISNLYAYSNGVNWGASTLIPVLAETAYIITNPQIASSAQYKQFYDADGIQLASPNNGHTGNSFTTPAGCAFIRISLYNSTTKTAFGDGSGVQLELGSTATSVEPYEEKISSQRIDLPDLDIPDEYIQTGMYADQSITQDKLDPGIVMPIADNSIGINKLVEGIFDEILSDSLGVTALKNKFNKATMIVDGKYISNLYAYSNGVNWGASTLIPVLPETAYIITNPQVASSSQYKQFFDADGIQLSSPNNGHTGNSFTTPAGCAYVRISLYSSSSKGAFGDGSGVQLELGSTATSVEPYEEKLSSSLIDVASGIPDNSLPGDKLGNNSIDGGEKLASESIDTDKLSLATRSGSGTLMLYRKSDGYIYVRSRFNDIYDILLSFIENHHCGIGIYSEKLVPVSNIPTNVSTGTYIKSSTDDDCPIKVNGGYIGGNHGLASGIKITKTAHGMTYADIGTEWEDSLNRKFVIVSIIDANNFVMLSENYSATDVWAFYASVNGTTLSELNGAKRTFTGWTQASVQLNMLLGKVPALATPVRNILINGQVEAEIDVVAYCRYVDLIGEYEIVYPPAIYDFCLANAGTFTDNISQAQIDTLTRWAKVTNRYRCGEYGSCVVDTSVELYMDTNVNGYIGMMQAAVLATTAIAGDIKIYAPGVKSTVANINCNINSFGSLGTAWTPVAADMEDENAWIHRIIEFAYNGDNPVIAFTMGYNIEYGNATQAQRVSKCNTCWEVQTNRKQYPRLIDAKIGLVDAGTVYYASHYRQIYDPKRFSDNASNVNMLEMNGALYVFMDYHSTVVRDRIVLPHQYSGNPMQIVESTDNVTIHTPDYLPAGGIIVSVDCSSEVYGYAILKIALTN